MTRRPFFHTKPSLYRAWLRLLWAYGVSFAASFTTGTFLIRVIGMPPESLFELSTKRIAFIFPALESSAGYGLDPGLSLFIWNSAGALVTLSFLYTAPLFNPHNIALPPRTIRQILCGSKRMKLLCFLPGCLKIEEESLRRVYVWLMVPWLGLILLGVESGLTASTSSALFGSYLIGFASLVPHGIVEIPTLALAGALPFTAHLLIKKKAREESITRIFSIIHHHQQTLSLTKYILIILFGLLSAGLIEGHITQGILEALVPTGEQ